MAKTDCDDCQKIVDKLQAALDDWYALQLADAKANISAAQAGNKSAPPEQESRDQKDQALAGLGQKERAPPKGKKKSDVKKEIDALAKELAQCLEKCKETPTPTPTPTPTATPTEEIKDGGLKLPTLPTLPPCWQTPEQKKKFFEDLDAAEKELLRLRKANLPEGGGKIDEEAVPKINAEFKKLNELKEKAPDIKDCGHGMVPKTSTGHYVTFQGGPEDSFCSLVTEKKITVNTIGTGETIGHVADLKIENLTDAVLTVVIPALILESRSGKKQDYACPQGETVEVPPHQTETVPLDGVCLVRSRPPEGPSDGGDLAINACDPDAHIGKEDAHRMLRIARSKYDAADKLLKDGKFKDFPYKDKKKQKDIVVQWSTWMDPDICKVTGATPATKDDLKKVVEKQVGEVPPDEKKKIDKGIDTIWDKIELTTEKAKDLEEPEGETVEETPPVGAPEYVGQGHTYAKQPTPTPTPKPKGGGTKTKPTPTPTPTPKPKGDGTRTRPTPTPTPTPEPYKDPADTGKPPKVKYPYKKKIDCGDIEIDMGTKGDLIFEFTPNGKCPCKKFGWIQHYRPIGDDENPHWHYDNGTHPPVFHGGSGTGSISHPDKPTQPTQPPPGTKEDEWEDNPWYGGASTKEEEDSGFAQNPKPKNTVHDKPNHPATTYRMQLVCVDTGEVLFTWAWGPFPDGNESPESVGGGEIPPPPLKK